MLFDDRLMAVANFGTGKLYPLSYNDPKPQLTEMQLPRLIENPDGMGLAPDGALIVLENAIQSGQGRILRIPSPRRQACTGLRSCAKAWSRRST